MLGSESGSNVFDFDGAIEKQHRDMTAARNGRKPTYEEFAPYISARENEIQMGQISPRAFECAVMKTPMVLFRGQYSGILQPDVHYVPLEIDFSNVDHVLERIQNLAAMESMAERTFEDVVASGLYGYRAYLKMLSGLIEAGIARKGHVRREGGLSPLATLQGFGAHLTEFPTPDIKGPDYFVMRTLEHSLAKSRHTAKLTREYYLETCERGVGEVRLSERHGTQLADCRLEIDESARALKARMATWAFNTDDSDRSPQDDPAPQDVDTSERARIFEEKARQVDVELEEWTRLHNRLLTTITRLQETRRLIEGDSFQAFATVRDITNAVEGLRQISGSEDRTREAYRHACQWADAQITRYRRIPGRSDELAADATEAKDRLHAVLANSVSEAEDFNRAHANQMEGFQTLSDFERADYLQAILARSRTAAENIGRMNEEYNAMCAAVAKLEAVIGEHEAKSLRRKFSRIVGPIVRRILKVSQ